MPDEKWQKVRETFDLALRCKPEERLNFVKLACGEDKILFEEVESLLASLNNAESFMETSALANVVDVIETEQKKFKTGKCIGHYEIIKPIGAGGMGEVYLATDKKLDRKVAIKILNEKFSHDESNLNRFVREAKAASALNHPNILVIHEIDESGDTHYIVSEFVEGATLREVLIQRTLKIPEILDISIQIAGALCTAHEVHLVHRDIKPENIMLRPDGYVKILDFGLAKLVEQEKAFVNPRNDNAYQNQTTKGLILGTINYMSPEQAKGERVNERTDIFSFGAVIYEMIANRAPFASDSMSETLANLINKEPPPLSRFSKGVPDELKRIVSKMLCKQVDERYQTMKVLREDLKDLCENLTSSTCLEKSYLSEAMNSLRIEHSATGDMDFNIVETNYGFNKQIKRLKLLAAFKALNDFFAVGFSFFANRSAKAKQIESVAVLPFVNISQDPATEYLSDGISECLIDHLSQLPQLKVIARSSSFKYRGENTDILDAANKLGAQAIITGRVARYDGNLLIRVEMIDAFDDRQLWSEQYNRRAVDLLDIQQEIARTASQKLRFRFSGARKQEIAKQNIVNPHAHELLLKGHSYRNRKGTENKMKAAEYYQQATDIDPTYATAFAALSISYSDLTHNSILDPIEFTPKAEAAARKALELDDNLAEAHDALALLKLNKWDWAAAEQEYQRAIELNPNFAKSRSSYAFYLSLMGRHPQAIAEAKRARDLSPLSPTVNTNIGYALYMARRYDEARETLNYALEMEQENPYTNGILAHSYLGKGMYTEAIAAFQHVIELGGEPGYRIYLGAAYAKAGERERAQTILKELETSESYVSPGELAILYTALNEREQAFVSLKHAYDTRDAQLQFLVVEPAFDPLRSDPRFQDLLHRVGLPV
jgi:serine/threonine-protein kinase